MEKERCDVVAVPDMPIEEVLTLALYEVLSVRVILLLLPLS